MLQGSIVGNTDLASRSAVLEVVFLDVRPTDLGDMLGIRGKSDGYFRRWINPPTSAGYLSIVRWIFRMRFLLLFFVFATISSCLAYIAQHFPNSFVVVFAFCCVISVSLFSFVASTMNLSFKTTVAQEFEITKRIIARLRYLKPSITLLISFLTIFNLYV